MENALKAFDIAIKDLVRSFRSATGFVFMFGVPLLVTGMFYFMFGSIAENGGFNLPRTKVIIANMDEGGPKFQVNPRNIPGGKKADTMGELIVNILQSDDVADLVEVSFAPDPAAARAAVDSQQAQVALIIPPDFSEQFADVDGKAMIEFYQDPTLTIGPSIMHSIMDRFMAGMSGVKIAVNVFMDEASDEETALTGQVVNQYLEVSLAEDDDPEAELLDVRAPAAAPVDKETESQNILLSIVGPIMGGMMIFYAFYTGTSTAQSILREEEELTLPRLFTTPTPQSVILTGKLLSVFLTVAIQVITLLVVSHFIFGIQWGPLTAVAIAAAGIVLGASSFGIFVNSFLKDTKQGGVVFGGILTVTGMVGMMRVFARGPATEIVSLFVPQGWANRALIQSMEGEVFMNVLVSALVLFAWSAVFFIIGVIRFNRRYV